MHTKAMHAQYAGVIRSNQEEAGGSRSRENIGFCKQNSNYQIKIRDIA